MLELIDLDQRVEKEEYDKVFPGLEIDLNECQRLARAAGVGVIVVFEGWDAAGKGTLVNRFTQAIDPRGFKVHPIFAPKEDERLRPWMWRFWNDLPAAGDWAIFDRSWYGRVLAGRVENEVPRRQWNKAYSDIRQFEQELADSGAVVVKLWLHISKREQKRRFQRLLRKEATAWKVGPAERRHHRHYDDWLEAIEEMIARTSTAVAPWTIVEATQGRWSRLKVFRTVIAAVRDALARRSASPAPHGEAKPTGAATEPAVKPVAEASTADAGSRSDATAAATGGGDDARGSTIQSRVDLTLALNRDEYETQLKRLQKRLFQVEHELYLARVPAVIAFEGWDAAGKGGNIRRLTRGLDPRGYEVVPIAAPGSEEKARHYLWRFWRNVPKAGHITIFDRTWYGRVLVERVEGFCTAAEWQRAYDEINEFERQLTDFGTVLVKFWLQIDAEEQLARFRQRQETPYKQWKITEEDWRNRQKRPQYEPAVDEMLRRTSTLWAPWTILEANCKLYARIKMLRTVVESLEAGLKGKHS
jgi:polyphosphate kinase 2 (PPK2 family)